MARPIKSNIHKTLKKLIIFNGGVYIMRANKLLVLFRTEEKETQNYITTTRLSIYRPLKLQKRPMSQLQESL